MISVVIPVYKNKEQLIQNLSHNLPYLKDCEVILVNDDPSASIHDILDKFPTLILLENTVNMGFGQTVNKGFSKASNDYVFLLNSDVVLLDDSYKKSLTYFKKDDTLFAVSFAQKERDGKVVGKNTFYWKRGFFYHEKADNLELGINGWAEGGSSVIDKQKFNTLHGFDALFSPFYWEDTDLSYRAWKKGYKVLFDPSILVEHHHESTIGKYIQSDFKERIAARNHYIFIWKNITETSLFWQHIFFLLFNIFYFILKRNFYLVRGFFEALQYLPDISKRRTEKYLVGDSQILKLFKK